MTQPHAASPRVSTCQAIRSADELALPNSNKSGRPLWLIDQARVVADSSSLAASLLIQLGCAATVRLQSADVIHAITTKLCRIKDIDTPRRRVFDPYIRRSRSCA